MSSTTHRPFLTPTFASLMEKRVVVAAMAWRMLMLRAPPTSMALLTSMPLRPFTG